MRRGARRRGGGGRGSRCSLPPSYGLIIAEKPKAAAKIAEALGSPIKCSDGGVPYYLLRVDGSYYVVGSAVGHLFGLTTEERGFPVFSYRWVPIWEAERGAEHARKFYRVLEKLCRRARIYVNACDYDIEGSVIGFMIIKYLGDVRRAYRMKFSALTPKDIRRAFANLQPLDWEMIEAGLARHILDWLWGVNVSRALMEALRAATGRRLILSAGRVQSPTLREAVSRDAARRLHVPLPRFRVEAVLARAAWRAKVVIASFDVESEARRLASCLRGERRLVVERVDRRERSLPPPPPFNLPDLQAEAARIYRLSPMTTQEAAERLYLDALISYPRTNSQKIPPTVDVRGIVESLAKSGGVYAKLARRLLAEVTVLKPRQGPRDDPAHPAIHPTGEAPRRELQPVEAKVYDLIVRRFLASMAPPARIAVVAATLASPRCRVSIRIGGVSIVEEGWLAYYPYSAPREASIPPLRVGDEVRLESIRVTRTYTEPPEAYTRAKLVKWMERVGIGTEGTRARIVETLVQRGYLKPVGGGRLEATRLGYAVAEVLEEYFPKLTSVELTREFEEKLEAIRRGRASRHEVIEEAKEVLTRLLEGFPIREAGLKLAYALGLVSPPKPCKLCGLPVEGSGRYCKYHAAALEKLREAYEEWSRRLESKLTWHSFLRQVASLKQSGRWVREVAEDLTRGLGE